VKLDLVLKEELLQSGCVLAPEDATQRGGGQKESSRGGNPSGTVECKTASRNNVVYVRMMVKVLSPSMEHAKKPDVRTQMFRVAGEFEQRRCASSEQQIVKQSLVLQGESGEFVRQGENDMKVRDGQQLSPALGEPAGAGVPLTSGAVPVTA
jgi:hypothetical protein